MWALSRAKGVFPVVVSGRSLTAYQNLASDSAKPPPLGAQTSPWARDAERLEKDPQWDPFQGSPRGVCSGPALWSPCLEGCGGLGSPEWVIWALGFEGCLGVHPAGAQWGGPRNMNGQCVCSTEGCKWALQGGRPSCVRTAPLCRRLDPVIMGLQPPWMGVPYRQELSELLCPQCPGRTRLNQRCWPTGAG